MDRRRQTLEAGGRFRATTVKVMQDGVRENFTAALSEPYLDAQGRPTDNRGVSFVEAEALQTYAARLDREGFQIHIHAIGDRGVHEALDALGAARRANGRTDGRHHIAHLQLVRPADVVRFRRLGVTANCQPLWAAHEPQMDDLTIPFIGPDLALWIRGDYVVSDATLNRFFAFHIVAIPLVLLGLVAAHILALHEVGSNNPDGVEIKKKKDPQTGIPLDGIPFHPYYTVHDTLGVAVFLLIFCAVMFFAPELGGYFLEYNNFIPADPLKTPPHIAPVWYFTPFYTILRATTDPMVNALCVIVGAAALLNLVKGKGALAMKVVTVVAAVVLIALMKSFDAKFWGVVLMGGGLFSGSAR